MKNLKTYDEFLNEGSMSNSDIQSIVDRVYPQVVEDLGKSKYVKTPKVELWKNIYVRVTGEPEAEGEHSSSSEAQYDDHENKIFIYYSTMKDEKHVIQSLLHEYTHALQDPGKWEKYREDGYDNNPYEKAAFKAEKNWKKYK